MRSRYSACGAIRVLNVDPAAVVAVDPRLHRRSGLVVEELDCRKELVLLQVVDRLRQRPERNASHVQGERFDVLADGPRYKACVDALVSQLRLEEPLSPEALYASRTALFRASRLNPGSASPRRCA